MSELLEEEASTTDNTCKLENHHSGRAPSTTEHQGVQSPSPAHEQLDDLERAEKMRLAAKHSVLLRHRGLLFVICVFFVFMNAGYLAGRHKFHAFRDPYSLEEKWYPVAGGTSQPKKAFLNEHPITKLMEDAERKFKRKLSKQSRTLKAAVKEYKRRYKLDPPTGFDLWWNFVAENKVKMTDEYDAIMEDLAPFWSLSGEELRRRALQVGYLPSIDLVRIRGGNVSTLNINKGFRDEDVSARATGFREMIEKFRHLLPDMDFPINAKAEGRVLVPWEHRMYPNITRQDSSAGIESMLGGKFVPDWRGDTSVWEAYRRTCHPNSSARRLFSSIRSIFSHQTGHFFDQSSSSSEEDFHFRKQTEAKLNFCHRPWARYTQGHFFSDWRTIPVLYPVFSPAKALGYMDIRIPSHYYYGSTPRYTYGWDPVNLEVKDVDDMEVPWESKLPKIFWRGATTGGGSHPPGFSHYYHRHRFLRMCNKETVINRTVTFADPPASTRYVSVDIPAQTLNEEIMDAAYVRAVDHHNYPGGLEAMRRELRFGDAVPLGKHWSYKYLIDLDGMSYSGRFLAFLASDSAAIKATIYQEYFTDWIQPWLHFIPLSSSYSEIYNIHAFFSGPTPATLRAANSSGLLQPPPYQPQETVAASPGDRRLRRIARAGKQWKQTIGRTVDMEAFVFRLCLEYARLWADDRAAMSFKL